ncbi:hypothetical protein ACFRB1_005052, partial [Salmonella enterica]
LNATEPDFLYKGPRVLVLVQLILIKHFFSCSVTLFKFFIYFHNISTSSTKGSNDAILTINYSTYHSFYAHRDGELSQCSILAEYVWGH